MRRLDAGSSIQQTKHQNKITSRINFTNDKASLMNREKKLQHLQQTICKIVLSIILLGNFHTLKAHIYPVTMEQRIDSAKQIAIAKVVGINSYWEQDSSNIYTAYRMEVICYAKNAGSASFFDLLLPGGAVGEDIQVCFPYIKLEMGYEYMVALEDIDLYTLNRQHARSSGPKFQPYSYLQGILPMHNGYYQDYYDTTAMTEVVMMETIFELTEEVPKTPEGSDWGPRTEFNPSDGDMDNDGVLDMYDLDANDPYSDSDGDFIADIIESFGDSIHAISNPLNPCDPTPHSDGPCIPIDLDQDGKFANFPTSHIDFDPDDMDNCIPFVDTICAGIDLDGDGYFGNFPVGTASHDPDDANACIPFTPATCEGIDLDGDGHFSNYPPEDPFYDPNDGDACIPKSLIVFGCPGQDIDGDGYFTNADPTSNLFDTNDYNPCVPMDNAVIAAYEDTYIDKNNASKNYGKEATLLLNDDYDSLTQKTLIRFDLVPYIGMPIVFANLKLFIENPANLPYELKFYKALQAWNAGTGTTNEEEACWNKANAEIQWLSGPGGHHTTTGYGHHYGTEHGWIDINIQQDMIQYWLDNPDNNFGIFIQNVLPDPNLLLEIRSSESSFPPTLEIIFDANLCQMDSTVNHPCDSLHSTNCIDLDGDGYYADLPTTDPYHDPNDNNACNPVSLIVNGCLPVDEDGDGYYANADPYSNLFDPNDQNACLPKEVIGIVSYEDTYIDQVAPGQNFALDSLLLVQQDTNNAQNKKAIIRFDLSAYTGQPIDYAHLKIFIDNPQNQPYDFELQKGLQDWTGGNSGSGTTSWDLAANEIPWQEGSGGFYDPNALGGYMGSEAGWINIPLTPDLIQEWIDNPSTNFGLYIKNKSNLPNSIVGIHSSESRYPPLLKLYLDTLNCQNNSARIAKPDLVIKDGSGTTTNTFYAGTIEAAHEMVLQGAGFGTSTGQILFPNADIGGVGLVAIEVSTDLIHWTDTEIRLKIPKNAGSGTMQIKHANGSTIGTPDIEVLWAVNPIYHTNQALPEKVRQRVHFVDVNDAGGYTVQVNTTTGFSENAAAVAALNRAISKWQCSSDVNWVIDETGTATENEKDGLCIAHFSKDLPNGVLAVATSRYKAKVNSSCPNYNAMWRLSEFDIAFADPSILPSGFEWNYTTSDPSAFQYDFESIALHELGHAHGLAHVIDESSVMHYAIANGETKRQLSEHELEGAAHKMSYSTTESCISSITEMSPFTGCDHTATPSLNKTRIKVFIEGFYDETSGTMSTELSDKNLLPLTQPFNTAPFNYAGTESVASIPGNVVDWMLLELRDSEDMDRILLQQPAFLRNDGALIALDGTEEIQFEEINAGSYYIALYHTNHLSVISSIPHPIQETSSTYDFTNIATAAMGTAQLKEKNSKYFMNSGDFDGNGVINNEDYNLWKVTGAAINTYSPADADGNGIINSLDYNFWKVNRSKIGVLTK